MNRSSWGLLTLLLGAALAATPDAFVGHFVGTDEDDTYRLEVVHHANGDYTGVITASGGSVHWVGRRTGEQLSGKISLNNGVFDFVAKRLDDGGIHFTDTAGNSMRFDAEGVVGPPSRAGQQSQRLATTSAVTINGLTLNNEQVAQLHQYGVQVQSGRYWYDGVCGAWGFEGGATMGFVQPGIPGGAPLQENASNGKTWVVVNGRRLPMLELLAMQALIGPILPGRYYLHPNGNAGFEGGPPMVNLRQASAQRGGGGGSSWHSDITGASGADDGQGSGFVSVQDSTGKSTTVGY